MHTSSLKRMHWFVQQFLTSDTKLKVLDVGSFDVNGSYRSYFNPLNYEYVGLDMEPGPNVDIVPESPYCWKEIPDDSFDVVISGQALEHIEFFWVTVGEMVRVLKKGGILCVIAPNGFGEHRYPVDCYRFFTDGMIALSRFFKLELLHAHTNRAPSYLYIDWFSEDCADSMLVTKKPYSGRAVVVDLENYKCIPLVSDDVASGLVPFNKEKIYEAKQILSYRDSCTTKTLDLGCGDTPRNPYKCTEVYGIDLIEMPERNIIRADLAIEQIPFDSEYFDVVTAFDFIEHIPRILYNPNRRFSFVELMNEIYRVLKIGGHFFSFTPAYPAPAAWRDPTHVNIITVETFPLYFDNNYRTAKLYGFNGCFQIKNQYWHTNQIHLVTEMVKERV